MRLHHIFFALALLLPGLARAYELVVIQGISETKRSFITRNGKRQGVIVGMTFFTGAQVGLSSSALRVMPPTVSMSGSAPNMAIMPARRRRHSTT